MQEDENITNIKFCKDCKHCSEDGILCSSPNNPVNLVSGKTIRFTSYNRGKILGKCKPEGLFFEQKEQKEQAVEVKESKNENAFDIISKVKLYFKGVT